MIPEEYDITIYRGGTFELPISMTDDNGPVDFEATYDGARMQIRPKVLQAPVVDQSPAAPILELTTTNLMLTMVGTVLTILIPASVTAALSAKSGVYDIELYAGPDGPTQIVDKPVGGAVTITGEVTVEWE